VRSGEKIARIVEEKDATPAERGIREINSGIYAFELDGLFDAVRAIASQNAQGEYYLPDLVAIYRGNGRGVETVSVADSHEILGINSRADLAAMNHIVRHEKNTALMASGSPLRIPPRRTSIPTSRSAPTRSSSWRFNRTRHRHRAACEIHSGARIIDSRLGDRVTILNHCVIMHSHVDHDASIGPLRIAQSRAVGAHAKVGNFVEMKNTKFGEGSKSGISPTWVMP